MIIFVFCQICFVTSLLEIAFYINYNNLLTWLLKDQFGVSATHLIKQRLLEELKNELLFSNRTVSEMADDFNFSDPSHLMRFFKQQTGKTFTQYMTDYNKGIYE